ncbi:oligosaccharide flippase family protein [Candidatus Roizmanbacteria bacterium]|nr:oligosaccharide flippase family protein [Candidatus Roizmanbacteria bacterium]
MIKRIRRLWRNEYLQGSFFLTASSFLLNIVNYFFYFLIARNLGPKGYGEIYALFSYLGVVSIPLAIVSTYIIKQISASKENSLDLAKQIEYYFWDRLKKWWPLLFLTLLLTPFIARITNLSAFVSYFFVPFMLVSVVTVFYDAVFQGLKLFLAFSILNSVTVFVKLFGAVTTIFPFGTLELVILFLILAMVIKLAGEKVILNQYHSTHNLSHYLNRRLTSLFHSQQFLLTSVFIIGTTLYSNIDIIIVKRLFDSNSSGLYSAWSLLSKIMLYAVGPLVSISLIYYSSGNTSQSKKKKVFVISLILAVILSLVGLFFYLTFPKLIILILFGQKFLSILPLVGYAGIYGMLFLLVIYFSNFLLAYNKKIIFSFPLLYGIYGVAVWLLPRSIYTVIIIDIIFSLLILGIYGLAIIKILSSKTNAKR